MIERDSFFALTAALLLPTEFFPEVLITCNKLMIIIWFSLGKMSEKVLILSVIVAAAAAKR